MNDTSHKLSIVIPCYNCEATLEETLDSVFAKTMTNPFEVIMVDDGSTDTTRELMLKLTKKYPHISQYAHEKNRGGGAARNTGIQHASGNLIYCLDSDNILDPTSMQKMINFLIEKKVDGVAFYERRYFHSQNKKVYSSHYNTLLDKAITLENIFDESGTLLDNFLFTKESFLRSKKYPEHHGFDTQSFEMRYLSNSNSVLICPDTFFYHRQNHSQPSYFEREFNKGNFSVNCYFAIEDIWHLFTHQAKKEILAYDIFSNSNLENNLLSFLRRMQSLGCLFNYSTGGENEHVYDDFIVHYHNKEYEKAFEICKTLLKNETESSIFYFSLLRSAAGLSGERSLPLIEKNVRSIIEEMVTKPKKLNRWYHRNIISLKGVQLIRKVWKK